MDETIVLNVKFEGDNEAPGIFRLFSRVCWLDLEAMVGELFLEAKVIENRNVMQWYFVFYFLLLINMYIEVNTKQCVDFITPVLLICST